MSNQNEQLLKAANHFLDLYADEKDSITPDSIHEWWCATEDQYEGIEYEDVKKEILSKL